MSLGNIGNVNSFDFSKLTSILLGEDEEETTTSASKEEETDKASDESIFAKKEIGGNGQSELKTTDDVDNALNEVKSILVSNSVAEYVDVLKAENKLNAQKDKIENEQSDKKQSILRGFIDALFTNSDVSTSIKTKINEIQDPTLQKQLKEQYEIFKDAEKKGEVPEPTIDLMS